jgi:hypothetical protein
MEQSQELEQAQSAGRERLQQREQVSVQVL